MNKIIFYAAGHSPAMEHAITYLEERGVDFAELPSQQVTHLLLGVPTKMDAGAVEQLLSQVSPNVTVIGGNLTMPIPARNATIDLLLDETYLAENADITADCAIRIAGAALPRVFAGCQILIIGWGRIGKCLAQRLKAMGADVTVAARKESDRAILRALGYKTEVPHRLYHSLVRYRVIFNTAPSEVLTQAQTAHCRSDCIKIDLASVQGIMDHGVIRARGLPGQHAPESSGQLIARSILRLLQEREVLI